MDASSDQSSEAMDGYPFMPTPPLADESSCSDKEKQLIGVTGVAGPEEETSKLLSELQGLCAGEYTSLDAVLTLEDGEERPRDMAVDRRGVLLGVTKR